MKTWSRRYGRADSARTCTIASTWFPSLLPPLRERLGDVAILLDHFLRMYCAANSVPLKRRDSDAPYILEEYHWPGNVRELENLVQRLVIMGSGPVAIAATQLPQQILSQQHR